MFHFPDPPPFFAIRYVKCISCNHIFPISEATAPVNGEKPTNKWRVHTEQVSARHQAQPHQAAAGQTATHTPAHHHIICTRCQAENDNWVYIEQKPPTIFSWRFLKRARELLVGFLITAVLVLLFGLLGVQNDRSDPFHLVVYIASLLVVSALPIIWLPTHWKDTRDRQYRKESIPQTAGRSHTADLFVALLLVFAFLMPLVLYMGMPPYSGQWYNYFSGPTLTPIERLTMVEQRLTVESIIQSPTARTALRSYVLLERSQTNMCQADALQTVQRNLLRLQNQPLPEALLADVALVIGEIERVRLLNNGSCTPDVIYRVQGLLSELEHHPAVAPGEAVQPLPDCQGEIAANFDKGLVMPLACNRAVLGAAIATLDEVTTQFMSETAVTSIEEPSLLYAAGIQAARRLLAQDAPDQRAVVLANLATLERVTAVTSQPIYPQNTLEKMLRWGTVVSVVLLISTLMGHLATERIIEEIDPHLPRPVFHRLSMMIRAVSWDIHQSLRKENKERQIEVIQVQRDAKTGGIKMHGILLDRPTNGDTSNRQQQREPDRYFWVTTDDRARVTESQIKGYGSIGSRPEEIEPDIFVTPDEEHSLRVRINRRLGWN